MKTVKSTVDYSKGMRTAHCGICRYFLPPEGCERVRGKIDMTMGCKLFRKKPSDK